MKWLRIYETEFFYVGSQKNTEHKLKNEILYYIIIYIQVCVFDFTL